VCSDWEPYIAKKERKEIKYERGKRRKMDMNTKCRQHYFMQVNAPKRGILTLIPTLDVLTNFVGVMQSSFSFRMENLWEGSDYRLFENSSVIRLKRLLKTTRNLKPRFELDTIRARAEAELSV
jgi:hypothetical protein